MRLKSACRHVELVGSSFVRAPTIPAEEPTATTVRPEADCPTVWSEGENVKWRAEVPGRGYSSPVVVGNRIFVTTAVESSHRVLALTAIDRILKRNCRHRDYRRRKLPIDPPIQFACLVDADLRRSKTVRRGADRKTVHLTALAVRDGEVLWTTNCGTCTAKWGFSGSLAYWRRLVYLTVDNPEGGWIAAFTAQPGEVAWRQKRSPAQEGSYSWPIIAQELRSPAGCASPAQERYC